MHSAFTIGLSGMRANSTSLNVVGNNLANSQTVGFKESDVSFTTQFLQYASKCVEARNRLPSIRTSPPKRGKNNNKKGVLLTFWDRCAMPVFAHGSF